MTAAVNLGTATAPLLERSLGAARQWWRPTPRRVLRLAAAAIVLQLVVRTWVAARGYFYWDDLILIARAGNLPLFSTEFLRYDHDGHFMPAAFLVAGIATRLAPLQWFVPLIMLVTLQALASLAVLRLLRLILGLRATLLMPLLLYLFSPLTLPAFAWWAAGLNALPLQIGLAWVAGDAVRLCRTGRPRFAVTGVLVFIAALLFFEKSVLVPPVAFAVVALLYRVDGRPKPLRTTARRGAPLWVASLVVTGAWAVVYLTTVQSRLTFPSAATMLGLFHHGTSLGLVPTLIGGPWTWDRWPPSPPWAVPPTFVVVLGWVVLLGVVVATVARKRRVAWVWAAAAAYVLASQAAMVLTRSSPDTAYELAQTLRYVTDSAVILAIALALILRAPPMSRRGAWSTAAARALVPPALSLTFVASCLWSTTTFVHAWADNPTEPYLRTARASLAEHTDAPLLDQPVSIWVLLPVAFPNNLTSRVFAPLTDRPAFGQSTPELRMIDEAGRIVDAEVTWVRAIGQGPEPQCGYRIPENTEVTLPLNGPMTTWEWTVQLNYFASADGAIEVSMQTGEPVIVPVTRGLGQVFVRLIAGGDAVRVRPLTPDLSLCIGAGPVGVVVPAQR